MSFHDLRLIEVAELITITKLVQLMLERDKTRTF